MKFNTTRSDTSGPSSTMGIMRFFDSDSATPKISPEFVIAVAVVFTLLILGMQLV